MPYSAPQFDDIPQAGQRGNNETRQVFVTKNNDFFQHLPTFGNQMVSALSFMQTAANDVETYAAAVEQAGLDAAQVALDKQESANSAAQAQASEQAAAQHVNTLIAEGLDANKSSEHNFKARQAILKATYDRSGFMEMGRTYQEGTYPAVNDGLWMQPTQQYMVALGSGDLADSGDSNSNHPIMNIDGVVAHIRGIDYINEATVNQLKMAPAPKVEHIDTTYGGRVKNSDFSLGDNGDWTLGNAAITGGKLTYSSGAADYVQQLNVLDANIVNFIEIKVESMTAGRIDVYGIGLIKSITEAGTYFIRHDNDGYVHLNLYGYNTDAVITKVAAWPEYQQNRTDLLMLEFFDEDTAEKGVLYRFGCTQDKTTDDGYLGVAKNAGTFNGADTYSLVSEEWQNAGDLVGNCYVIADLTFAQLAKFTTDPTNNCYYTPDGKLIQARRYRYRSIMGKGDVWTSIQGQTGNFFAYSDANVNALIPKGTQVSIASDLDNRTGNGSFGLPWSSYDFFASKDEGLLTANGGSITTEFSHAHNGQCYAYVLGVSPRLNQGAYHWVFNKRGASLFEGTNGTAKHFYESEASYAASSIICFQTGATTGDNGVSISSAGVPRSGYLASADGSGRPDNKLYDSIESDSVVDYRLGAKADISTSATMSHMLSGHARGLEGGSVFERVRDTGNLLYNYGAGDVGFYASVEKTSEYAIGDIVAVALYHNGQWYMDQGRIAIGAHGSGYIRMTAPNISAAVPVGYLVADGANFVCWSGQSSGKNSGQMSHCDIIGSHANYPQWLKDALANGYSVDGSPLLVGENGEDYTDVATYTNINMIKASRKIESVSLVIYSDDNGATWTTYAWGAHDATLNRFPSGGLVAGRVYLVFYKTKTKSLQSSVNSSVDGELGDIFVGNGNADSLGANFINDLLGKVAVNVNNPTYLNYRLSSYALNPFNSVQQSAAGFEPSHDAIAIGGGQDEPTVKVYPYKSDDTVKFVFKEMKKNGVSWGDNSKFLVQDNIVTDIDSNGLSILAGQREPILKSDLRN